MFNRIHTGQPKTETLNSLLGPAIMDSPQLGDNVKIHYTCTLEDGSVIDSTRHIGPLELTLGTGRILPEIERAILNMKPGESSTVTLTPDKTYGPYQPELVTEIEQQEFLNFGLNPEIGLELDIQRETGELLPALVTNIESQKVRLDANHPYAGLPVRCDIQLVSKTV